MIASLHQDETFLPQLRASDSILRAVSPTLSRDIRADTIPHLAYVSETFSILSSIFYVLVFAFGATT